MNPIKPETAPMYSFGISNLITALFLLLIVILNQDLLRADELQSPRHRTLDLNVGDVVEVELVDTTIAKVKMLDVQEIGDTVRNAIRALQVKVEINGSAAAIALANYRLPITVGEVQVDCPATRGLNESVDARDDPWGLRKDVRLRSWPAGSNWMPPDEPGTIGAEYVRRSPALTHDKVEVTASTRMITNVTKPTQSIYRPDPKLVTGSSKLICPGGGYWDLYWELEGEEVARWLTSHGITGIILKCRVPRRPQEDKTQLAHRPLQDAQRAMSLVRSRAKEWGLNPERIGMIGLSAGGHLAIATAMHFDEHTYAAIDEVDQVSSRPDFAIAAYPGYLKVKDKFELSSKFKVSDKTPPVFLAHGSQDPISPPSHSVVQYLALQQAGVPVELHLYASTTHDFGVRSAPGPFANWTDACLRWLDDQELASHSFSSKGTAAKNFPAP